MVNHTVHLYRSTLTAEEVQNDLGQTILSFVRAGLSTVDHLQAEGSAVESEIAEVFANFPITTFGSPPAGVEILSKLATKSPFVVVAGYEIQNGDLLLAGVAGLSGFFVWFVTPHLTALRDDTSDRLKSYLKHRRENE